MDVIRDNFTLICGLWVANDFSHKNEEKSGSGLQFFMTYFINFFNSPLFLPGVAGFGVLGMSFLLRALLKIVSSSVKLHCNPSVFF